MAQVELRISILGVYPKDRAVVARYWTPAMKRDKEPRWQQLAAQLKQESINERQSALNAGHTEQTAPAVLTDDQAYAAAQQREPIGTVANFQFPGAIPSPEELNVYLRQRAPLSWLHLQSKTIEEGAPDMSALEALIGQEFASVETFTPPA
jgi:hypothetical protein